MKIFHFYLREKLAEGNTNNKNIKAHQFASPLTCQRSQPMNNLHLSCFQKLQSREREGRSEAPGQWRGCISDPGGKHQSKMGGCGCGCGCGGAASPLTYTVLCLLVFMCGKSSHHVLYILILWLIFCEIYQLLDFFILVKFQVRYFYFTYVAYVHLLIYLFSFYTSAFILSTRTLGGSPLSSEIRPRARRNSSHNGKCNVLSHSKGG